MIPPKPGSGLYNALKAQGTELPEDQFWEDTDTEPQVDLRRKRHFRIAAPQVESLRAAAKKFEGSHNFHNFTVGRDFRDRSNQRFLKSIEVGSTVPLCAPSRQTHFIIDLGAGGVRRYGMDKRVVTRTELHAAPGQKLARPTQLCLTFRCRL